MPNIEVRTYKGRSQAEAAVEFGADAGDMAAAGWEPIQQLWSGPTWWPVFLTPPILMLAGWLWLGFLGIVLAGVLSIIFVIAARPKGALTVTYSLKGPR